MYAADASAFIIRAIFSDGIKERTLFPFINVFVERSKALIDTKEAAPKHLYNTHKPFIAMKKNLHVSYFPENNCHLFGKSHEWIELPTYIKCRVCGSSTKKPKKHRQRIYQECDCCKMTFANVGIDHDHRNGLIRGFLCQSCSRRTAYIESGKEQQNPEILLKYLENPPLIKYKIPFDKKLLIIEVIEHIRKGLW